MKKKIGIIGYGTLGQHIENFLIEEFSKEFLEIYYFDDNFYKTGNKNVFRFIDYYDTKFKELDFYIGLGYNNLLMRKEICEQLINNKFKIPSFIHKTAYINSTAKIADGVIIYPLCNIDHLASIDTGVVLNNSSIISHNSFVGSCTYLAPAVVLSGNVSVGKLCFIGTGSVVANKVKIGNNVVVGIGSNITKDIKPNVAVIGNPFRIINKNLHIN